MNKWQEFRLIITHEAKRKVWPKDNYDLIRSSLLPIINQIDLEEFLILNYFQPGREDLIRFRVPAETQILQIVKEHLDNLKIKGIIHDYEEEVWEPAKDASNRINSAKAKLEQGFKTRIETTGWQIVGKTNSQWMISSIDYGKKLSDFNTILTRVVGRCTKAFIEELGERPIDRWLMSLFIHLLLNSICCSKVEEREIRDFPYV